MAEEIVITPKFFSVLGNKNFLKIWLSQIFSQVTTHLINFALILRIYKVTGSALAVSLIILAFGIPAILFSLFGGVYVDRFSRKRILMLTNFLQAVIVPLYILAGVKIGWIFLILFIYSFINQFYFPAEGAMIPYLVDHQDLVTANSFYMFTFHASFIIGYTIASPVISFLGENAPYIGGLVMLAIAFLAASFLPYDRVKNHTDKKIHLFYKGVFADIKECWQFIVHNKEVALPIIDTTLSWMMIGILAVLSPAIASEIAKVPLSMTGLVVIVPAALGMLLGTIIIGSLDNLKSMRIQQKLVRLGIVLAGMTLIIGAYTSKLILFLGIQKSFIALPFIVIFLAFLLGLAGAFILTPARTLIYKSTTHNLMGRILAVLGVLITLASTLPVLLAAAIADYFSIITTLVGLGLLVLVYEFLVEKRFVKKLLTF